MHLHTEFHGKKDYCRLRYENRAIFKKEAVRHLQFSKVTILVTWPVPVSDCVIPNCESPFQVSHLSDTTLR